MPSREDILEIAQKIRYDLTAAQGKLTELVNLAAQLPASDPNAYRCHDCELRFKGERSLAEHRYHQHDGPEPPHWLAAEALASPAPVVAEHVHAPAKKGAE